MKIKAVLCSVTAAVSLVAGSLTAYAEEIILSPEYEMHDNVCGKVCIAPDSGSDTYVQVYKNTPESPDGGFLIYDSIIEAGSVNEGDVYVLPLECNSINNDTGEYESSYLVKIGIPKYKTSSEPVYYTKTVYVDDTDYLMQPAEYSDIYVYNVKLTDSILASPSEELVSSESDTSTYNITFTSLEYMAGDANEDGVVNIRDASFIARKIAEQKTEELPACADFNSDGTVNIRDAAAIAVAAASGFNG